MLNVVKVHEIGRNKNLYKYPGKIKQFINMTTDLTNVHYIYHIHICIFGSIVPPCIHVEPRRGEPGGEQNREHRPAHREPEEHQKKTVKVLQTKLSQPFKPPDRPISHQ